MSLSYAPKVLLFNTTGEDLKGNICLDVKNSLLREYSFTKGFEMK
jgi:hypothetical protein